MLAWHVQTLDSRVLSVFQHVLVSLHDAAPLVLLEWPRLDAKRFGRVLSPRMTGDRLM